MGTAQVQGDIWGARAKDWADLNEPAWAPLFRAVLNRASIRPGIRLLDIGCGSGGALVIARDLGADVSGLDASENLAAIARDRLPGASIKIGEMEELPFDDEMFDVITGINSFQFAGDIVQALREARRVCRHRGTVAMLVWGRRQDCELLTVVMPAVFALLPPANTNAPPLALAEPGVIEGLMREAGLSALESSELANALAFPDQATAVRAIMSAAARAIRHAGEEAVRRAIAETLARVVRADGSIVFKNHFRLVTARRD